MFLSRSFLGSRRVLRSLPRSSLPTLVLADHENNSLLPSAAHAVQAASLLSSNVSLLVAGKGCENVAKQASLLAVSRVLLADHEAYEHALAENLAALLLHLQKTDSYQYLIATANPIGKSVMPRLAGMMDVAPITDVVRIKSGDTFVRPTYAGSCLSTVRSHDAIKILTVRATSFAEGAKQKQAAPIVKASLPPNPDTGLTRFVKEDLSSSSRPDLASASVVVAGGRGLGSKQGFELVNQLADQLGAAVGASRAAVDSEFTSADQLVGQTGNIVAPSLYVALGVSGAVQHVAGMHASKRVLAINSDREAPIFDIADLGVVGKVETVVPELCAAIAKAKQEKRGGSVSAQQGSKQSNRANVRSYSTTACSCASASTGTGQRNGAAVTTEKEEEERKRKEKKKEKKNGEDSEDKEDGKQGAERTCCGEGCCFRQSDSDDTSS